MNGALQVGLCSRKALPRPLWTPSELWLSSLTTAAPVTHPNTSGTKQNPTHTARRGKTAWKDTARLALFAPVCSAKVEQFSLSIKYLRLLSPKSAVLVFAVAGSLATHVCVCIAGTNAPTARCHGTSRQLRFATMCAPKTAQHPASPRNRSLRTTTDSWPGGRFPAAARAQERLLAEALATPIASLSARTLSRCTPSTLQLATRWQLGRQRRGRPGKQPAAAKAQDIYPV